MTTSTLDRFVAAIELADTLPDPAAIYRAILAGSRDVDDGLKAASYDGDRVTASSSGTHPERMLARRHPGQFPDDDSLDEPGTWGSRTDRSRDDLLALRRATDRVLDAVSALNAECCDAGTVEDWDAALKDAHLLASGGYITAALDVGRHIDHWLIRFAHAVDTVRAIRDSWMAHEPPQSVMEENFAWCQNHGRIGVQEKRITRRLCQWCWRHVQDLAELGEPVVLQEDPANWPSEEMMRAKAEGRDVLFKRERQAWLRSKGLDPARVHQQRQERRSA